MSSDDRIMNYETAIKAFLLGEKTDPDFIKQCFWELKAECDSYAKRIARWRILGFTAVCLFELLNRRLIGEVSLSGIEVIHLSFLLYIIPPAVTVSLLTIATLNIEQDIYIRTLREFSRQQFPALYRSEFIKFFIAQQGILGGNFPRSSMESRTNLGMELSRAGQGILLPIAYLAFEFYAYLQLFTHTGRDDIPAVISLCASVILLTLASPLIFNKQTLNPYSRS
jgi:hypothetical protein